jgi:hypothetical protein
MEIRVHKGVSLFTDSCVGMMFNLGIWGQVYLHKKTDTNNYLIEMKYVMLSRKYV